jgi:phosphatidylserine decarboxylase
LFPFFGLRAAVLAAEAKLHPKWRIASAAEKFYFAVVKHSGKASVAALKLIGLSGAAVLVLIAVAFIAKFIGSIVIGMAGALLGLWALFVLFTFYFFRDPDPAVPTGKNLVLAPGHGKVDTIDTTTEAEFMGGECQRISIFLSVFDVHVQNAPLTGRIAFFKHSPGQYLNAMRADCGQFNENVLLGLEAAEPAGAKIGVRLIAGLIARRIVPWIAQNDLVQRGERISLIQFGSRADVYLPKDAKLKVRLGDHVVGGETILAELA